MGKMIINFADDIPKYKALEYVSEVVNKVEGYATIFLDGIQVITSATKKGTPIYRVSRWSSE